jgi:hypothetical protein
MTARKRRKLLRYEMLTEVERARLRASWRSQARAERARERGDDLIDMATRNFEAATNAIAKGGLPTYLTRGAFGTGAAVLGWTGKLLARFAGSTAVDDELLARYGCEGFDLSSFPDGFV